MNIQQTIAAYLAAKQDLHLVEDATIRTYSMHEHYAATDRLNRATYKMINHADWTAELQDKFYPDLPGAIAYPVSC